MGYLRPLRLLRLCLVAVIGLAITSGCRAPPQEPLRVGTNPWIGYDPLAFGRELGLIDGRRVKIIELTSATESQRAMRNGLLDAAGLTLDEALRLADGGLSLKIISMVDVSCGGDAVLAPRAIAGSSELKGRRIGLEQTALGALMLARLLKDGGLLPGDVRVVQLEAGHLQAALGQGLVDAVITFEPMRSQLLKGGYHVIFDSTKIPGEVFDVIVATNEALRAHPEQIKELLKGWETSRQRLLADPGAAARMFTRGSSLSPSDYLEALKGLTLTPLKESVRLLGGDTPPLAEKATGITNTLLQLGLIRHPPDWKSLVDGRPAQESSLELERGP